MRKVQLLLLGVAATAFLATSCQQESDLETESSEANLEVSISDEDIEVPLTKTINGQPFGSSGNNLLNQKVPKEILELVRSAEMNTDYVEYRDFFFPDGTSEKRIFIEDDMVLTLDQLRQMASLGRQYITNNLVSQGRNISIIGYTGGGGFGLSSKEQTGLRWAVNNYNRLGGVSIRFTLTFGTNFQSKDMVVYHNPNETGSGGSAGFPSNGLPNKFVQIFGLDSFSTNVNEHVITHEIGHSVGFRHTDYFSRQSCGQNTNEGNAGVGANHVSGTPTGFDSTSIMLACFSNNEDGEFNGNDRTALRAMY